MSNVIKVKSHPQWVLHAVGDCQNLAIRHFKLSEGKTTYPQVYLPRKAVIQLALELLKPQIGQVLYDELSEREGTSRAY